MHAHHNSQLHLTTATNTPNANRMKKSQEIGENHIHQNWINCQRPYINALKSTSKSRTPD